MRRPASAATSARALRAAVVRTTVAVLLASAPGCSNSRPSEDALPAVRVIVVNGAGEEHAVDVEVPRTNAERRRGLMYRRSLAPDAGMLFVFRETTYHRLWMWGTYIPLDMIFIDDAGRIVGIVENAMPRSTKRRDGGAPSRYVLEVNGGWSAAHRVAVGDRVRFENVGFE